MNREDVVITSRVRLARNISDMPFPHKLNEAQAEKVMTDIYDALVKEEGNDQKFKLVKLKDISATERLSLAEAHKISYELAGKPEKGGYITNEDGSELIMLNEEDHIRLQVINKGFELEKVYKEANVLDDAIEKTIDYAFDGTLGYLTSCPTNAGTGIRASFMIHLPALTLTKSMAGVINTLNQVGMTIRGLYGEGTAANGSIYQISNQITLGLSEDEILNNLQAVVSRIIDKEIRAREYIYEKQKEEIEDDVYRSLGMLKYTRKISSIEALNLLSKVRMGVEMGIINEVPMELIDGLLTDIQPATIQLHEGKDLSDRERDILRASIIRDKLRQEG